jgi:hypothetical protein
MKAFSRRLANSGWGQDSLCRLMSNPSCKIGSCECGLHLPIPRDGVRRTQNSVRQGPSIFRSPDPRSQGRNAPPHQTMCNHSHGSTRSMHPGLALVAQKTRHLIGDTLQCNPIRKLLLRRRTLNPDFPPRLAALHLKCPQSRAWTPWMSLSAAVCTLSMAN